MWDDENKVTDFKRSHWIHLGRWSTGSPKLQLFQLSQHSQVTNCRLISSSAYFPWNVTLKYKMQLSEGSRDKILHSKSRTQCFLEGRNIFFLRFVFRSDIPSSGSIFRDFFVKTTKESEQPFLELLHRLCLVCKLPPAFYTFCLRIYLLLLFFFLFFFFLNLASHD